MLVRGPPSLKGDAPPWPSVSPGILHQLGESPVGNFSPTSPLQLSGLSPQNLLRTLRGFLNSECVFILLAVSQMCLTDVRTKSCPWKSGLQAGRGQNLPASLHRGLAHDGVIGSLLSRPHTLLRSCRSCDWTRGCCSEKGSRKGDD